MPTYLRRFYYNQLLKTKDKETKESKKSQNKSKMVNAPNIARNPNFKQ